MGHAVAMGLQGAEQSWQIQTEESADAGGQCTDQTSSVRSVVYCHFALELALEGGRDLPMVKSQGRHLKC